MQEECRRVRNLPRSIRRHHRKRIIRKFKRIAAHWSLDDIDSWAKRTAGRGSISCGCQCCKSPRRGGYGDSPLTIQERKFEIYKKDWEYEH
jgi:hypothetical protein